VNEPSGFGFAVRSLSEWAPTSFFSKYPFALETLIDQKPSTGTSFFLPLRSQTACRVGRRHRKGQPG